MEKPTLKSILKFLGQNLGIVLIVAGGVYLYVTRERTQKAKYREQTRKAREEKADIRGLKIDEDTGQWVPKEENGTTTEKTPESNENV